MTRDTVPLTQNKYAALPLAFPSVFSGEECELIRALGRKDASYFSSQPGASEGYRNALTCWMRKGKQTRFITERLAAFVLKVNRHYEFELDGGFAEDLLFAEYRRGDGFEWHADTSDASTSTRKLSLSVQLSDGQDYSGGQLQFMPYGQVPFSTDRGTVIIFPSYLCHRVRRVTRGKRAALVAWSHGHAFR